MEALLVTTPVLVPLATALVLTAMAAVPARQRVVGLIGAAALLASAVLLLRAVRHVGAVHVALGSWPAPYGIELVADPLGATLALITAVMGAVTVVYLESDADAGVSAPTRLPLVFALLAGVGGSFITGDLFNLYVWFELMLAGAVGLLVLGKSKRHLEATLKYFLLNAFGTLLLVLGVAYLYAITGHLGFGAVSSALANAPTTTWVPFVVTVLLALLVKAGALPLFAWLPGSYPTLPAPVLALFAGLLTKVGVYAVLRVLGDLFPATPLPVFEALGVVAVGTMLVGVLGAAYHWDMRRILAFHIISQIGYMLLGIALGSAQGQVGTIFYVVHHIIVKANLFLVAGIVFRLTGSYDLRRCGGLYAARPLAAVLFAVPALSLVGIPPLSGFWAKFIVVRQTLEQGHVVWASAAIAVGVLTLYSMMKIWFGAFWKKHPTPDWTLPTDTRLAPAYAVTACLSLITLGIGLFPEALIELARDSVAGFARAP
jgi:multicomponent Na+:H+ antiporter subunit D